MESQYLPFIFAIAAVGISGTSRTSTVENDENQLIVQLFADYCTAPPVKKHEFVTDRAFCDSLGETLYAHKTKLGSILAEFGIVDFELPLLPVNYRRMPDAAAIAKASEIREKLIADLFDRLGDRKLAFYQRILELRTTTKGTSEIVDICISEDSQSATADMVVKDSEIRFPKIPIRFAKIDGKWYFDGKDETVFFERQRSDPNRNQ